MAGACSLGLSGSAVVARISRRSTFVTVVALEDRMRRAMGIGRSISLFMGASLAAVAVAGCGGDQDRINAAGSDVDAVEQLLQAPSDALVDKLVAADVAVPGQPASDGRIFKGVVGRPTCRSNPSEDDQRGYRIDCELTKASTFLMSRCAR